MHIAPKQQKYLALFRLAFVDAMRNYKALIGLSLFLIICLVIFANLWRVVAAKVGVVSFNPTQLLWYIAFNEWVLISIPHIQEKMEQDLRSGRLAYLLPRPISYLGATFAEATGTLFANLLLLGTVTFAFTYFQTKALPFPLIGLPVTLLFGFLAGLLGTLFHVLIGVSAFWLHEVDPFFWVWEKMLFLLGGLMLPLAAYPQWLQTAASFTPFPAILGGRSALAIEFSLSSCLSLMASLLCWGTVGALALVFTYRKGLRILEMEGG